MYTLVVTTYTYTNGVLNQPVAPAVTYSGATAVTDVLNYLQSVGLLNASQGLLPDTRVFWQRLDLQPQPRIEADFNQPSIANPVLRVSVNGVAQDVEDILRITGFYLRIGTPFNYSAS